MPLFQSLILLFSVFVSSPFITHNFVFKMFPFSFLKIPLASCLTLQQIISIKSSVFWDITPCNPLKIYQLLPVSCWFLAWLIWPWKWRQQVPPKHRLTFNRLHSNISQKIELFNIHKDQCLLGCDAMYSGRKLPVFQRNLLPLLQGRSETVVTFYLTTQYHIPEDCSLDIHCHEKLRSHK
jgi:hypothetical protein